MLAEVLIGTERQALSRNERLELWLVLISRGGQACGVEVLFGVVRCLLLEGFVLVAPVHVGGQEEESRDVVAPLIEVLACRVLRGVAAKVIRPDMLDIEGILDRS